MKYCTTIKRFQIKRKHLENGSILITPDPICTGVHNLFSTIDGKHIGSFRSDKKIGGIGSFTKSKDGRIIAYYSHYRHEPEIVIDI